MKLKTWIYLGEFWGMYGSTERKNITSDLLIAYSDQFFLSPILLASFWLFPFL